MNATFKEAMELVVLWLQLFVLLFLTIGMSVT